MKKVLAKLVASLNEINQMQTDLKKEVGLTGFTSDLMIARLEQLKARLLSSIQSVKYQINHEQALEDLDEDTATDIPVLKKSVG